jgi:uncharacterized phage infection (PIP) family protein YhgE
MLGTTIIGMVTAFQLRANARGLSLSQSAAVIAGLAVVGSFAFTLVDGLLLHRLNLPVAESWAILTLQLLAVSSFATLMSVTIGPWAILPTWLLFVVLGNSSSGGAVAPPLLPPPLAFLSRWLPSGSTVTALREAVYFPGYQHARPIAVLATWSAVLFAALLAAALTAARQRPSSP